MKTVKHFVVPGVPWTFGETTEPTAWTETTEGEERDSLEYTVNASGGVGMSYKRYFNPEQKDEVEAEMQATVDGFRTRYPATKKEAK